MIVGEDSKNTRKDTKFIPQVILSTQAPTIKNIYINNNKKQQTLEEEEMLISKVNTTVFDSNG